MNFIQANDPNQSPRFAGLLCRGLIGKCGLRGSIMNDMPIIHLAWCFIINFQIIALGGSIQDFNDFSKVLGPIEYQNFIQAPPQVRQRVLENYNSLLNAFNSRSLWFGELLEVIFEHRPVIMKQLAENLEDLPPPQLFTSIFGSLPLQSLQIKRFGILYQWMKHRLLYLKKALSK